jgi:acyl transferase domain-containing protein
VRFSTAVGIALASKPDSIFLEINPLAGPIRQICLASQAPFKYSPTLVRGGNSSVNILSTIGRLYQEAVPLDFTNFNPDARVLQDLPTYAWDHEESYLGESRLSRDWRHRQFAQHPLLGARVPEAPGSEPQWRNMLYLEEEPWLADHKMGSDIIYPFAAYISMAAEAMRQMNGGKKTGYRFRHTVARSALVVNETKGHELVTTLLRQRLSDQEESEWFEFTVSSYEGSSWQKHCSGQIKAIPIQPPKQSARHLVQFPRMVDHARYYDYAADIGMNYGTEF